MRGLVQRVSRATVTVKGVSERDVVSDLVVKTVFATLPELIDPPAETLPAHLSAEAKIIQQLRFIMVGGKHWQGLGKPSA